MCIKKRGKEEKTVTVVYNSKTGLSIILSYYSYPEVYKNKRISTVSKFNIKNLDFVF